MNRKNIKLKNIVWVIGYKKENGSKVYFSIPYVLVKDHFDYSIKVYDLTRFKETQIYKEEISIKWLKSHFEKNHKAVAMDVLNSETILKEYVLEKNSFKTKKDFKYWYENKFLTPAEGVELMDSINESIYSKYNELEK